MPADPARVKDLFAAALGLPDPAARAALLDRECGADPELRRRVDQLLRAHDHPESALDGPLAAPAGAAGTVVAGRYKLLERIGEGGVGEVWVADQQEPVRRRVALKLIKPGMDSRSVLARFEAERQALALMDHPHIAKVLDGGAADDGRPFFVMELVKGTPITRYCDDRRVGVRGRLGLFADVCRAVQHAHQKGVIHRDLKPSNVLVAPYDGRPVVKVIDFGVAKAAGQPLTEKTLFTGFGAVVGTLEYMSPEQAELNNADVDTRSDVYSLGVVLYELLTGTTPITRQRTRDAGLLEALRLVREEEPPRPSTRLGSTAELPAIAAARGVEAARLPRLVRGELDWIVLRCLEKDRARRYETADAVAAELARYLADEPVLACPPSTAYRVRKFYRRNRLPVVAAGLVAGALVAGTAGTAWQAVVAGDAREKAVEARNAETARAEGERAAKLVALGAQRAAEAAAAAEAEAKDREAEAKRRAVDSRNRALAALRATTDEDVNKLIGEKPELGPNERAYLLAITKRWEAFADQAGDDEDGRRVRGEGYHRVTRLLGRLGLWAEARAAAERARDVREGLAAESPGHPDYRRELGFAHHDLGTACAHLGLWDAARAEYDEALRIRAELAARSPAPELRNQLAATHQNLADLHLRLGRTREAIGQAQESRDLRKKLVEQFPDEPGYQSDLADALTVLGTALQQGGHYKEAAAVHQFARDLLRKLVRRDPGSPKYRDGLASAHNNLGNSLRALSRLPAARAEFAAARDAWAGLVGEYPVVGSYRASLGAAHNNLGALLVALKEWDEARAEHGRALAVREKLAAEFPDVPAYRAGLGGSYGNYGLLVRDAGDPAGSLEWFARAIDTLTPLHDRDPRGAAARADLRNPHLGRAATYDRLERYADAVKDWDRALELSPERDAPAVRALSLVSRLRAGMVADAVAAADELRALKWSAERWCVFARVYAAASARVAGKEREYADRAVEMLTRAVGAGYDDAGALAADPDLAPLRGRADFRKLLASIPKPAAPPPRPKD